MAIHLLQIKHNRPDICHRPDHHQIHRMEYQFRVIHPRQIHWQNHNHPHLLWQNYRNFRLRSDLLVLHGNHLRNGIWKRQIPCRQVRNDSGHSMQNHENSIPRPGLHNHGSAANSSGNADHEHFQHQFPPPHHSHDDLLQFHLPDAYPDVRDLSGPFLNSSHRPGHKGNNKYSPKVLPDGINNNSRNNRINSKQKLQFHSPDAPGDNSPFPASKHTIGNCGDIRIKDTRSIIQTPRRPNAMVNQQEAIQQCQ